MSECAKNRKMEGKREFEDCAGSGNLGKRGASWKRRSMSILILCNQRQCGIIDTKQSESVVKLLRSKYSAFLIHLLLNIFAKYSTKDRQ